MSVNTYGQALDGSYPIPAISNSRSPYCGNLSSSSQIPQYDEFSLGNRLGSGGMVNFHIQDPALLEANFAIRASRDLSGTHWTTIVQPTRAKMNSSICIQNVSAPTTWSTWYGLVQI